jgi:ribonuclease HII
MFTIGVDEAGRGPLAGPVCAGAVVLHADRPVIGLTDSKKLSAKKRQALEIEIKASSMAWGIGWASVEEIDELNILRATFLAMSRAVLGCIDQLASHQLVTYQLATHQAAKTGGQPIIDHHNLLVKVDGNHSPASFEGPWAWPYPTQTIIQGDLTEPAISAASILAKTARDTLMQELDRQYPQYGFAAHAGYGTAQHLENLKAHGPSPVHRKSFSPVARFFA